jgi:ketosteroid isomerase-like protein
MSDNKTLVDRVWKSIEGHDMRALEALMTPDVEMVFPGGVRFRGWKPLEAFLTAYVTAFPNLRHETLLTIEQGNKIAVELKARGTHTGPMVTPDGTIPPTGREVLWESVDLMETRDGKVAAWRVYNDQVAFLTALGLMPAKG